jgi:hypothetical protein
MDFVFCVKHVMAVTDFEHRPSLTLEKFDEILDRIIIISSFLSINLRKRIKKKYAKLIRINNTLSSIFRRLKSLKAK